MKTRKNFALLTLITLLTLCLTVAAGEWQEEIRCGETGEIRSPAEAFREGKTGKMTLRISRLFDPGNGDPRRLGLFIW